MQRLADQLEVESSLETATARENIQTVGMRLEELGRLLLDLGGAALTLGRDSSEVSYFSRAPASLGNLVIQKHNQTSSGWARIFA